jgi:hypothetical protein
MKIGKIKAKALLEFGKGDIQVVNAKGEDYAAVLFRNSTIRPIGSEDPTTNGTTTDDFKPNVVMAFDSTNSIDLLIEVLENAKQDLQSIATAEEMKGGVEG